MYILDKSEEINRLIQITKSDSGISGPELVKAHIRLGEMLGENIKLDPEDTTVVALLRGGIFFAQGIYMSLGCKFEIYNPKLETFVRPKTKNILLVDSVINTGKTIDKIMTPDMKIACCVISDRVVEKYNNQLYAVRISKNSFVGQEVKKQSGVIGPDTTMRLFNSI